MVFETSYHVIDGYENNYIVKFNALKGILCVGLRGCINTDGRWLPKNENAAKLFGPTAFFK